VPTSKLSPDDVARRRKTCNASQRITFPKKITENEDSNGKTDPNKIGLKKKMRIQAEKKRETQESLEAATRAMAAMVHITPEKIGVRKDQEDYDLEPEARRERGMKASFKTEAIEAERRKTGKGGRPSHRISGQPSHTPASNLRPR
jgi:hypothetical protein